MQHLSVAASDSVLFQNPQNSKRSSVFETWYKSIDFL